MAKPLGASVPWEETEDMVIASHIDQSPFPAPEISRLLNRTVHSVKARAQRLRARRRAAGIDPLLYEKRNVTAFHKEIIAHTANPGAINCLNCTQPFKSWDVKKNRLCPKCSNKSEDTTHTRHTYKKGFV